jgi:hypothetical protein
MYLKLDIKKEEVCFFIGQEGRALLKILLKL